MTPLERGESGTDLRFVAVSNRLPIVLEPTDEGWSTQPGAGGLVSALAPVLRNRGGLWIGWPGTDDYTDIGGALDRASKQAGYRLHPVLLSPEEVEHFYYGFCNETLWPLFHDLSTRTRFYPEGWTAFVDANRRYAGVVARRTRPSDYVWVHDYHLLGLARELRAADVTRRIGFFLHIPFPPLDMFLKLPWRAQILGALLDYDLIGFQTLRDRRNFLYCVKRLIPGIRVRGSGAVLTATYREREVRVGTFPISIDYREFSEQAASSRVAARAAALRDDLGHGAIALSVDRLDYTKGIPERLEAIRAALLRYPELHGNVTFVQIAVPSRQRVPEYQALRAEIDRLVGEVNGQFTRNGWIPIHYLYRSLDRHELLAHYRVADIGLVTPLRDGMNLVAKEFCACQADDDAVLVLSEFAGCAAQLYRWAVMVNPHDVEGTADAIYQAFVMAPPERRNRMRRLRLSIRRNDIFHWVDDYLDAAVGRQLADFPYLEDYIPPLEGLEA